MKSYLTRTPGGERKRREGGENTNTNTPGPERANPERQGKRKAEADGQQTRPEEGGEGRKRLNKPDKAKPKAYLGTRRTKTYLKGGARMKIRDQWGLVNEMVHPQRMQRVVIRLKGPRSSNHPCKQLYGSHHSELGAQFQTMINSSQNGECPIQRPLCSTIDRSAVRLKKGQQFTLLRRITNYKSVNSESDWRIGSFP